MRSSVALVYLRRFVPERGLSLRAAILSLANRLSHLLTRAARVCIFKAICLPFSPLAARRITLALWTIRCSAFELRIQRKSVSFSSVERRISGAGRLISPAFSIITLSFARKYLADGCYALPVSSLASEPECRTCWRKESEDASSSDAIAATEIESRPDPEFWR